MAEEKLVLNWAPRSPPDRATPKIATLRINRQADTHLVEAVHSNTPRLRRVVEVVLQLLAERRPVVRIKENDVLAVDQRAGEGRVEVIHHDKRLGRQRLPQPEVALPLGRVRRHHDAGPLHRGPVRGPALVPVAPVHLPDHRAVDVHLIQPARHGGAAAVVGVAHPRAVRGEDRHVPPRTVVPGEERLGVPQRVEVGVGDGEGEGEEVPLVGPVPQGEVDGALVCVCV